MCIYAKEQNSRFRSYSFMPPSKVPVTVMALLVATITLSATPKKGGTVHTSTRRLGQGRCKASRRGTTPGTSCSRRHECGCSCSCSWLSTSCSSPKPCQRFSCKTIRSVSPIAGALLADLTRLAGAVGGPSRQASSGSDDALCERSAIWRSNSLV